MTELDAQLARRKLTTITRNLDLLATVEGLALNDYQSFVEIGRRGIVPAALAEGLAPGTSPPTSRRSSGT